jgi:GTPase SAR1 family protein
MLIFKFNKRSEMQSKNAGYDFLIKIILVGDTSVGKTSLLVRFSDDSFMNSHIATIGKASPLLRAVRPKFNQRVLSRH